MTDKLAALARAATPEHVYAMGLDCGRNGANTTNCDFRLFATPELTKEWERGKRDALTRDGTPRQNVPDVDEDEIVSRLIRDPLMMRLHLRAANTEIATLRDEVARLTRERDTRQKIGDELRAKLEEARVLLREASKTMRHARVFITSDEKMHTTGVELYDELLAQVTDAAIAASAKP